MEILKMLDKMTLAPLSDPNVMKILRSYDLSIAIASLVNYGIILGKREERGRKKRDSVKGGVEC
jgi:hypothetical protein